jgi:phospholipid/cholesterol/gamma-HCH transport system ATP-binding protein
MTRLRDVGLGQAADRHPAQLSGGMKKRAGLARALALDPGIVLCDEPDSGLDPVRTALLADLLIEQHAMGGGTMLVVTHNIALAKRVADHITVLWQGTVRQSGMAVEIFESDDPFVQQFLAGRTVGPLSME